MAERKKSTSDPESAADELDELDAAEQPEPAPSAADSDPAVDAEPLRVGASGDEVRELQRALNRHGAGVQVDGRFTPSLGRSLARVQRELGLDATGELDAETRAALGA